MRRGRVPAPHEDPPAGTARPPTLSLEDAGSTPILRAYRAVKAAHPDAIVMARLGDFFELFGDDAVAAAPVLGVALTGRGFGGAGRLPMCGVPAHAVGSYIGRLLGAGHRVALWDQVEDAAGARGLVRREVTRVLSPGTVVDEDFLDAGLVARCVALWPAHGCVGVAALDAAAGVLELAELAGGLGSAAVREECERSSAAELVVPEQADVPPTLAPGAARTAVPAAWFSSARGAERLIAVTGAASLRGFGVDGMPAAHAAAGAVLAYSERNRVRLDPGYVRVRRRDPAATMRLDAPTRRNLELAAARGERGGLLAVCDRTRTPMGARLLRARLVEPLLDSAAVDTRLDAVAALRDAPTERARLRGVLARVGDLERLAGRCVQRLATPRDLAAVAAACGALSDVADAARHPAAGSTLLQAALGDCRAPDGLGATIVATLVEDPPATLREGGAVRQGADSKLDALRAAGRGAREFIASLEERERARSGIRSLRVGYNRVFGYYLEVSNAHAGEVPTDYVRKQTLVGAERFVTAELKEQENAVLSARERSLAREVELVAGLVDAVAAVAGALTAAAAAAAELDVAQSLAEAAEEHGWCRPQVDGSTVLELEGARHPLVEAALPPGSYVANDCSLEAHAASPGAPQDGAHPQVLVITGPNMAGKSTYLRSVAVCALLAQVGSFVPARRARLGLCDRIFTRVGAHDELAAGLSTFMVEMTETAAILHQATPRSLVILDEIGRGTSTYDGLSIAQAVLEHLHDAPQLGCRALFATHYHELTALAAAKARVRNARVEVVEEGESVTFLHRIVEGGADRSYGIHVARLAGVPGAVLGRARQLLGELEAARPLAARQTQMELPLGVEATHPVVEELGRLDVDGLTPLMALNKLAELRAQLDPGAAAGRTATP